MSERPSLRESNDRPPNRDGVGLGLKGLYLSLLVGVVIGAWWFGFRRMDERRASLEAEIAARTVKLDNLRAATAGIADMDAKTKQLEQAIAFFEAKLPSGKEIDKVLREVWQLAESNGLTTRSFMTLKTLPGTGYSEQPIQMQIAGDFDGYYQFLLDLEQLPRITRVTKMNLSKIDGRDDKGKEGKMQAAMTLSIFFEASDERVTAKRKRSAGADSVAAVQ